MTKRLAVGLLVLPLMLLVACGGDLPKGAIALVGQVSVTQDQLDVLRATYEAAGRAPDKDQQPAAYQSFEKSLAEYLVVLEVLRQEAPANEVTVTEADVQKQTDLIEEMFQGDQDKFAAALKKENLTLEQFTQSIRDSLLYDGMMAAVTKGVSVSEEEVKAYYQAHKADFVKQESRATRHILIAPVPVAGGSTVTSQPTQADWDAAKAEAENIRSEIQNGAKFSTEAEKYSDDATTKDSGGEMGAVIRGQLVPAFEEAVFSLPKGEISEPVKTQYGYHLIQVTEIYPEEQLSYDEVKENVRSSLLSQKRTETWQGWLTKKKTELNVVYRQEFEPEETSTTEGGASTTTSGSTSTSASTSTTVGQ